MRIEYLQTGNAMRRDSSPPEAYRADIDEPRRERLEAIRAAVVDTLPRVKEGIAHEFAVWARAHHERSTVAVIALHEALDVLHQMPKAVQTFLIVSYAEMDGVTLDVGFY